MSAWLYIAAGIGAFIVFLLMFVLMTLAACRSCGLQGTKVKYMHKVENIHETPHDGKPLLYAVADLKRYSTIVVDPPWAYGIWGSGSAKALVQGDANKPAPLPYNSMTVEEIKALPLKSLANENCELYLWTTQKYLPDAFDVIKAWGFKYCQTLTWCKKPMGKGQGGVYCPTTEFLILARRGKMPKVERVDTTWWEVKKANEAQ